jgi:hypothetical protein
MSGGGKRKRNSIAEQFIPYTVRMLESPAYQVLSLSARRVLARIEIEHAHHGGNDNGKLPVTYDDFVHYGVNRHAVGPAIRECGALGFTEITERGYAGNAEFRRPNKFRLTYIHTGRAQPTYEWDRIKSIEEAEAIARQARLRVESTRRKNRKPVSVSAKFRCRKPSLTPEISSVGNHHYSTGMESDTTSISRVGIRK